MRGILVALSLSLAAAPAIAAPPTHIPISAIATPELASNARLSPDGSRIAIVGADKDRKGYVLIVSPQEPSKILSRLNSGAFDVDDIIWATNEKLILPLNQDFFFLGIPFEVTQFAVVDLKTSKVRKLAENAKGFFVRDVLAVDPGGQTVLVSGTSRGQDSPSVQRLDLATGALTEVQERTRGVDSWFVDEQRVVRGGMGRDGSRWTLYYRSTPGGPLQRTKGKFDKRDEEVFESVYFSPVNDDTIVISNHATGRFAAYRLDLATVEPGALIFENPQGDIDSVLRDPLSGRLIGFRYHNERWRTHFLDSDLAKLQAKIDRALPGADNLLVDWSTDRKKVLVRSASSSDPGIYYLFDRDRGELKIITAKMPGIPIEGLSQSRYVRYRARDGLTIPAYLTLPRGRSDKGLPLVVMPHGGPFARDTGEYDGWVQMMANRGYAVLQPQFRGTTGFGRHYVERGFGEWGRKMQDDVDDGIDWLASTGTIDPKRVCIAGGSYGGYAAIWGAIRSPGRYRCAISWAGVTDLRMMLKHDRSLFAAPRYYRDWKNRVVGYESRGNLDEVSPLKHAARMRVPLLLGHGKEDSNVPIAQAEALEAAFAKAGVKIDSVHYDKAGHNFDSLESYADWLGRVERFLARHNPANQPPGG